MLQESLDGVGLSQGHASGGLARGSGHRPSGPSALLGGTGRTAADDADEPSDDIEEEGLWGPEESTQWQRPAGAVGAQRGGEAPRQQQQQQQQGPTRGPHRTSPPVASIPTSPATVGAYSEWWYRTHVPYTCTTHMYRTHVPHMYHVHVLYSRKHVHHACTTQMYLAHVLRTCTSHMYHTHVPHTCAAICCQLYVLLHVPCGLFCYCCCTALVSVVRGWWCSLLVCEGQSANLLVGVLVP